MCVYPGRTSATFSIQHARLGHGNELCAAKGQKDKVSVLNSVSTLVGRTQRTVDWLSTKFFDGAVVLLASLRQELSYVVKNVIDLEFDNIEMNEQVESSDEIVTFQIY